jgi:hypothetical protein
MMNVKGTAKYVNGRFVTELEMVPPEAVVPVVEIIPPAAQPVAPPSARPEYQRQMRALRIGKSQSLAGGALERFVQAEMEKYRAEVILFLNPLNQASIKPQERSKFGNLGR